MDSPQRDGIVLGRVETGYYRNVPRPVEKASATVRQSVLHETQLPRL